MPQALPTNRLLAAIFREMDEITDAMSVVPAPPSPDQMLTTPELAGLLSMKPRTVEGWRADGTGPLARKVAGSVRYRYADVLVWIQAQNS
jgi:predicted DNA-binding transcriptional regulator AlpA